MSKQPWPKLSAEAQEYLPLLMWWHSPIAEPANWLAALLHEPILRRVLSFYESPPGGPPLEALTKEVTASSELLGRVSALYHGHGHKADPVTAFLEIVERITVRAFAFDGVDVFGTHYQAVEITAGFDEWRKNNHASLATESPTSE